MSEQRSFIEQSKRFHDAAQITTLILKDDGIEATTPKIILELLVSQYATALTDSCLMNMCNEPYQHHNKLPLPIVFAMFKQQINSGQISEALKLLQVHVDRKSLEKVHILIYNLTKIYALQCQYSKQTFYLETILKQEPFFPEAAHDLAITYAFHHNRLNQAIVLLQRHLNSVNAHNSLIHSAYIRCLNIFNGDIRDYVKSLQLKKMTLINYFNLGLLLKKKGIIDRSSEIFTELIHEIGQFEELSPMDSKLLLISKIHLIKIRQDQKRFSEASMLADILLDADSEQLDVESKAQLVQISQKKNQIQNSVSENIQRKHEFFKISSKKRQGECGPLIKKKEASMIDNMLLEVKEKNDKKFKHLLNKEKSIDKFFKNIMMRFSANSQQLQINLKNSLIAAKGELNKCPKDLHADQYEKLQFEFQKSRLQYCSQLEGCDIEQSIRIILFNLQNLKHGQHFKRQMLGFTQPEKSYSRIAKISVRTNVNTSSFSKRQIFSLNKQKRQPSERGKANFRIKNYTETPPEKNKSKVQKNLSTTEERTYLKTDMLTVPVENDIFDDPRQEQQSQFLENKAIYALENKQIKPLQTKNIQALETRRGQAPKTKKMQVNQTKEIQAETKQIQTVEIKQAADTKEKQGDKSQKTDLEAIVEKENIKGIQQSLPNTMPQFSLFRPSSRQKSQEEEDNVAFEISNRTIQQNTPLPDPHLSLFKPFVMPKESEQKEDNEKEVIIAKQQSQKPVVPSSKNVGQRKITQQIFEDKCLEKQSEKKIDLTKISFKKFEEDKKSEKMINEFKRSFKKIDTAKNSLKRIDINKLSQKKIDISQNYEKKIATKKPSQDQRKKNIEKPQEKNKRKVTQENQFESKSPKSSPRQSSEFNFKEQSLSGDDKANQMLGSSFNINTASLATFNNAKHEKKNKLAGQSTFAKAMEGLMPKIQKKETSTLSAQFHVQMLKVTQLERKQQWDKAYQRLMQIYKYFKKEDEKIQILLRIGSIFQKQEKYPQAEKTYLKCSKFNSADAFLSLGNLQLKIGKIEQGVQNLEKANCIRRFDITIENKLVYGYSLREDTMDKALKLAHCILKKEPNSLETLLITAGILEKQGLIDEAIQIVKAIDQVRQTEHIKHYLGILHLAASNLKEAFQYFKQALAIKPDYAPSLIQTASIISETYPKQAIAVLNKALELSPGNRRALARLGKIYEAESDFENAMNTYKAGLQTQANYESYMKIGDCLAKKESYIEALLNYKEAINLKKTSQAYAKLALMFEHKNDCVKAIENYQSALAVLDPSKQNIRREYLMAIGRLHLKMGQYETAIGFLEQLLETSETASVFKLLGQAYFGSKQYQEALGCFQKANALSDGINIQVLENMAMCLDRLEQYLASKVIYEKILEKSPHNIRCLNNLANIMLITGETNEAFFLFQSILEKMPKNIERRLKLADIYAQVGDWSKVQYHLIQCYRQKQHDSRILEKLVVLYKEKRDNKMAAKYEKKLALLRTTHKHKAN